MDHRGLDIDHDYISSVKLRLPFREGQLVSVSEGYFYSSAEKRIHGLEKHYGVDFAASVGTPVYASHDGFALQSRHEGFVDCPDGATRGYGLGKFVAELCFTRSGDPFYVTYAHLSAVDGSIPFVEPKWDGDECDPTVLYQDHQVFQALCTQVRVGDLIGHVGQSGLAASRGSTESWDEPHLHSELFARSAPEFSKNPKHRFDSFGLYAEHDAYRDVLRKRLSERDLWERNPDGSCIYAAK